jgi:hypothetical protein
VVGEQHHLELARELEAGIRQMDAFTEGDVYMDYDSSLSGIARSTWRSSAVLATTG